MERKLIMIQKFIRFPAVKEITGGTSRVTIWRWVRAGIFPAPIKIGPNSSAWLLEDVLAWVSSRKKSTE